MAQGYAAFPTGNAFIIRTPKTDRLEQQIVQDQKQKDLAEQRQSQLLDSEFSKNAAAIRDIDVKPAIELYGKYKQIGKELYKNGNKMPPEKRIAMQLEKQRAASDYYTLTAKSKELKDVEDLGQKNYFKDPNKMEETTPDYLLQSRNTPVLSHPGVADIMNNTELKTKDFSKIVSGAMGGNNGKPIKVANDIKDNGNLTSTQTDYLALNSPSQFSQKVQEGVFTNRDKNKFVLQHSYDDLAAQDLLTKYNELRQTPAFKKAYPNEPEISPDDLNDPFKKAVTLLSLDHILRHPPIAMEGKPFNNTKDVIDYNEANRNKATRARNAEWDRRNIITNRQKNERLDKLMNDETVEYPLDVLIDNYGQNKDIKSAEGFDFGTISRIKESDIPVGQLDLYNKPDKYGRRQVDPLIDPETKERYYNSVKNPDGHWELIGADNKKIGADDTRDIKINKTIPSNKLKQDIYFNKGKGKEVPTLNASEYKKKRKG